MTSVIFLLGGMENAGEAKTLHPSHDPLNDVIPQRGIHYFKMYDFLPAAGKYHASSIIMLSV